MRRLRISLVGWWSDNPWIDYILAATILAFHLLVVNRYKRGDFLSWITLDQRLGVYETGATVISVLGGLSAIAATVYMAATGQRARKARLHFAEELRRNWTYLLVNVGASALICLCAQALDNNHDPHSMRFSFEYAILLAIFSFSRLVWLFDSVMAISNMDAAEISVTEAPPLNPVWKSKLKRDSLSG
ncbi:hypothetical protein GT755_11900 [Herbidospora sp. NEAU-GS84]|uniref:Uncharacterized protein n=1 Tax=Herbidospora solisilvae TaxID=2696284 RepID=A0A7C9J2F9_9ACTN|nr:hypothetical protein [Herbidospora solisilvae]NAS22385.1 hypothetical protein [Herbidospora solisilvae]